MLLHPVALAAQPLPSYENGLRREISIKGQPVERVRLADRMVRYKVPGVSVAIIQGCQIVEARGFGVVERGGAPIDAHTLFQAASISKPVNALGALRLVDQGKLTLDADVRTTLKGWTLPDSPLASGHPVTLRRLLTHSAGLTVHGFRGYPIGTAVPTVPQVLDGVAPANSAPVRIQAIPGLKTEYSGGGTTISQLLIEEAGGKSYASLMHDLVLAPAKMTDSSFQQPLPAERAPNAAVGHRADGNIVVGKWHVYPEMAAAGLWTTPTDLARFLLEIARAERGEPGALLSPAMAKDMLTKQIGNWGLGLTLRGEGKARSFGHGGANEGYRSSMILYPDTCQGAAVMTNSDSGSPLMSEIMRAVADAYGWPDPRPSKEMETVAMNPAIADRFVGTYRLQDMPGFTFRIRAEPNGGLSFIGPDGAADSLLASSADMLFSIDSGVEVRIDPASPNSYKVTPADSNENYTATRIKD